VPIGPQLEVEPTPPPPIVQAGSVGAGAVVGGGVVESLGAATPPSARALAGEAISAMLTPKAVSPALSPLSLHANTFSFVGLRG
jgi:hypothetical protein